MTEGCSQKDRLKWWLTGWFGKLVIDLIGTTMRLQVTGFEKVKEQIRSREFILAFWHSRMIVVLYCFRHCGGLGMVSRSNDGEIVAQILRRHGNDAVRGSTSRDAVRSLAEMIRRLKAEDRFGALTPDGPRGPRFRVQPGVITLAQKTGFPIVPITYSAKRVKVFQSWDRFMLPCPGTDGCLSYGDPLRIPHGLDPETREFWRKKLENDLNRITTAADRRYGHLIV